MFGTFWRSLEVANINARFDFTLIIEGGDNIFHIPRSAMGVRLAGNRGPTIAEKKVLVYFKVSFASVVV